MSIVRRNMVPRSTVSVHERLRVNLASGRISRVLHGLSGHLPVPGFLLHPPNPAKSLFGVNVARDDHFLSVLITYNVPNSFKVWNGLANFLHAIITAHWNMKNQTLREETRMIRYNLTSALNSSLHKENKIPLYELKHYSESSTERVVSAYIPEGESSRSSQKRQQALCETPLMKEQQALECDSELD